MQLAQPRELILELRELIKPPRSFLDLLKYLI